MFTLIIFVFMSLALLALFYRRTRICLLFSILGFLFFFLLGTGLITQQLIDGLRISSYESIEWKANNAIVLLGGGTNRYQNGYRTHPLAFSRIYEATRLYNECRNVSQHQCTIVVSGGDPKKFGISEAHIMKNELFVLGVRADDIILEENSNNTFQNAKFTSEILKQKKFDQTIIVSSGIHIKRSLLYFSHFGIKGIGSPSDQLTVFMTFLPISYNLAMADLTFHEYMGHLRYKMYQALGWNSESEKPGTP